MRALKWGFLWLVRGLKIESVGVNCGDVNVRSHFTHESRERLVLKEDIR